MNSDWISNIINSLPIIKQSSKLFNRLFFRQDIIKLPTCSFWSWCDTTEKIEIALINMLFEYVEKDAASMEYEGIKLFFPFLSRQTRSELGIKWLKFQMNPDGDSEYNYYLPNQLDEKILDLYLWFKNEYSYHKEKAFEEWIEDEHSKIIDEKLKEIINCRYRMWT